VKLTLNTPVVEPRQARFTTGREAVNIEFNLFIMTRRYINPEIDPEQIFGDSLNIPGFDEEQFEGRIERPISKYAVIFLGLFFLFVGGVFTFRVWSLQVARGDEYSEMSERNHLRRIPIFAERGIIYDRNKTELAWNTDEGDKSFSSRAYIAKNGFGHILGYVSTPKLDQSGNFWQTESIGKDGVEKFYNDALGGKNGVKLIETDVGNKIKSESALFPPEQGKNITLTIDARVQEKLWESIASLSREVGFSGGAGVIMDVSNGEILAMTSFPEYSSSVLVKGEDSRTIGSYLSDRRTPFLNRAASGLYTPGSIIKPFIALGALTENIISPSKEILSAGSISIPNPYNPSKPSVFKDWKAHGWVDMRRALSVSSDVYFYEIGGGFEGQRGLGIENIEKYAGLFGFGKETGIDLPSEGIGMIPNPEWKAKNFNGEKWLLGNTYHTAIGQYGFQVTPLQVARGIAAVASDGILLRPRIVKTAGLDDPSQEISIDKQNFSVVKEGMRQGVLEGTAKGLNIYGLEIAAKTGTAELGAAKKLVNSWVVGFFPYDNPRYAFAVVMEKGPVHNTTGGLYVMRQVLEWMQANTPEYLQARTDAD